MFTPTLFSYYSENFNLNFRKKFLGWCHYRLLFKMLLLSKKCNRVANYSKMTVIVEKRRTRVWYVFQVYLTKTTQINGISAFNYLWKTKPILKVRRMSAQKPMRSVGVVQAELGSRKVCLLSQYLLYLTLTLKTISYKIKQPF